MIIFARLVLRGATALLLALAAVPAMAQFSTPIRDVENPARSPFRASATINVAAGFAGVLHSPLASIPENRRLVIETVSVRCASAVGNNIVYSDIRVTERVGLGSTGHVFQVPIRFQGTDPFSGPTWVGVLSSRIYSDAGLGGFASVNGGVIRETGTGTAFCTYSISGYTIGV